MLVRRGKTKRRGISLEEEDRRWEKRWKELGYDKMVEEYEKKGIDAWEECYRSSNHTLARAGVGEISTVKYIKRIVRKRKD